MMINRPCNTTGQVNRTTFVRPDFVPAYRRGLAKNMGEGRVDDGNFGGVEFALILTCTVYFGALASAVTLPEDDVVRTSIFEFAPWASHLFTILAVVYVVSPLSSSSRSHYQLLTRAAVIALTFLISGMSAQIEGIEAARSSPIYAAHLSWQGKVKERTQALETRNSDLEIARRDYDACVRQRDALRIEARLQSGRRTPLETIGLIKRIRDFCRYERKIFEQMSKARDEQLSSMEALLREKPTLDVGSI